MLLFEQFSFYISIFFNEKAVLYARTQCKQADESWAFSTNMLGGKFCQSSLLKQRVQLMNGDVHEVTLVGVCKHGR